MAAFGPRIERPSAGLYQLVRGRSSNGIIIIHMFGYTGSSLGSSDNSGCRSISRSGGAPTKYKNAKQISRQNTAGGGADLTAAVGGESKNPCRPQSAETRSLLQMVKMQNKCPGNTPLAVGPALVAGLGEGLKNPGESLSSHTGSLLQKQKCKTMV